MQKVRPDNVGFEQHACDSQKKGDWIIFSCTQCQYERRFNYKTKEVEVQKGQFYALHQGAYYPTGIQPKLFNLN